MKIVKQSIWLELDEFYEKTLTFIVSIPYYIERLEEDNEIIWFGLETNWKKNSDIWYILDKGDWLECNIPHYEKSYQLSIC